MILQDPFLEHNREHLQRLIKRNKWLKVITINTIYIQACTVIQDYNRDFDGYVELLERSILRTARSYNNSRPYVKMVPELKELLSLVLSDVMQDIERFEDIITLSKVEGDRIYYHGR